MGYSAVLPGGTCIWSGPDQISFWMTGRRDHVASVGLVMDTFCTAVSRTVATKVTAPSCCSASTHMPERLRNWSSPPSTLHRTRSARMSLSSSAGWNTTSSRTSWLLARKPSSGVTWKEGAMSSVAHVNLVPTSPVLDSIRCFTSLDPFTTGPKLTWSVASLASMPRHAPDSVSSVFLVPATCTTTSSVNGRWRAAGRNWNCRCTDSMERR
mmetsp:Transcript_18889/g.36037  ORF Transcript_18889/g.36037 Transcript_18889/m.36037 type:complete len:211 (+) Transcript_18889:1466-2098(+)